MRFPSNLRHIFAAVATIAIAGGIPTTLYADRSAPTVPRSFDGRIGSTLGTPDQVMRDKMAARIFASAPVQNAIVALEATYAHDSTAAIPDATSTLKRAAEATAMAQAASVVDQDPDRPAVYWSTTSPHAWGSAQVPLAGLMVDDTDNIYRTIPIDGAAGYEIHGRIVGTHPSQESFILHETASGATKDQPIRNHEDENGALFLDKLVPAPDGSFTITVDSTPVDGRLNHIQTRPEARDSYILIRDSLDDWTRENPVALSVKRVSGPPLRPASTEAQLAGRAAAKIASVGPYWLAWAHQTFYSKPANGISFRVARVSGWGYINCGHYQLADDEALVIRLERRRAAYLGFQLSDAWGQGQAMPFIEKLGSLNGGQALPNPDGSYTYLISKSDPSVHNWLDPDGLRAGTFCIRWQGLPDGMSAEDALKDISVAKLQDLDHVLADVPHVTPDQRRDQLRERREAFLRRLTI